MYHKLSWGMVPLQVAAIAATLTCSAVAFAQGSQTTPNSQAQNPKVSDAQVEASVLKALAGASDLANQPLTTTTVYGVVTLSGSVQTRSEERRVGKERRAA